MRMYCFSIVMVTFYIVMYTVFGDLLLRVMKKKAVLPLKTVIGFFTYYLMFYIIAIPMKFLGLRLSALSITWMVILGMVVVVDSVLFLKNRHEIVTTEKWCLSVKYKLAYGGILLCLVFVMNVNQETGALWDESHYVGEVSTLLYEDALVGFDMYTGEKTDVIEEEYLLEVTETHSAVMSQVFQIHPLIEVRTLRATAFLLVFYLLVMMIGSLLFKEEIKRFLFFVFFVLLDMFSYNTHTRAQIMLYRAFEGKAVMANTILFAIFFVFLLILKDCDNKWNWQLAFLVVMASFGLNMTSILLVPPMFGALVLPMIVREKKFYLLPRFVICLLPWIPEAIFYVVMH